MKGFSLVELIIVLAIISILAGITFYSYKNIQSEGNLFSGEQLIVRSLRRAQIFSQAAYRDNSWGVHLSNDRVVVFNGSDFLGRDQSFDEIFNLPEGSLVDGLEEIVFDKLSGFPNLTGEINFKNAHGSKDIFINSKGTILY